MGEPAQWARVRAGRARVGAVLALLVVPLLGPGVAPAAAGVTASATPEDVTYYVVKESWEGEPEFLYSIAARLLGNGDRAMEIYALNEGRAQPGGATVSDPNVIRPGWVLQLPSDATGDGVLVGPLPTPPPVASPTPSPVATADRSGGTAPTRAAADDEAAADDTDEAAAADDDVPATQDGSTTTTGALVTTALVVAGATAAIAALVLLVGGVRAVTARRRAGRVAPRVHVHREDPGSWTIDRTTRALARACADAGRPVPRVHALVLSDDLVTLRLGAPDARPPAGWSAGEDGRTWTSPMRPLQEVALDDLVVAPFPRLVTLGDAADGRVLVDLAQAGPGIAIDGDPAQATLLAERWLHELATSPWSRHVPLVAVGTEASPHDRLEDARTAVDAAGGGVLVVVNARARDANLLAGLADDPAWSVVVVGPGGRGWARWRLTVAADGVATGGPLDADVHVKTGRSRLELV